MAQKKRVSKKDTKDKKPMKKKVSILQSEGITYVDYKDVNLLRRFMSERAKIRARRVTGNDTQQQAEISRAIRNAREMGLLPYSSRQVTQRKGGRRGRDRDKMPREDAGAAAATAAANEAATEAVTEEALEATDVDMVAAIETAEAAQ